jgi:hypothetical protein
MYGFGGGVVHRRCGLGAGSQGAAAPSIRDGDEEPVASRFNRDLIYFVGCTFPVVEGNACGCVCIHAFPFV